MRVQSTVQPQAISTDEYRVYINTNITSTTIDGITMYEYEQERYSKDEYMQYLQEQLTNAQFALVELYESMTGGDNNG